MRLEVLRKKYAANEPMCLKDIISTLKISPSYGRKLVAEWTRKGEIRRFSRGIYYFPKASKLFGEAPFDAQRVLVDRLLGNEEAPLGYYSGLTLANKAGITSQVPAKVMIVSNAGSSTRYREISIGKRKIIVRRSKTTITKDNKYALSLLDLIAGAAKYSELDQRDTKRMIKEFAIKAKVSKKQILDSLDAYPAKVSRELMKMEIYDVLA